MIFLLVAIVFVAEIAELMFEIADLARNGELSLRKMFVDEHVPVLSFVCGRRFVQSSAKLLINAMFFYFFNFKQSLRIVF